MAAGVTPAVNQLTEVLKEAVANSKIVVAVDKIIGQILGLLVDLILLPFLPILIWILKGLLAWVIDFGKWWNEFWKGPGKVLIDGIKALGEAIAGGLGAIINFGIKLVGALVELGIGFLKWLWGAATGAVSTAINIAFGALGAVYDFLKWVWGVVTKGADVALKFLFGTVPGIISDLLKWVWNLAIGAKDILLNLKLEIPEPIKSLLSWLKGVADGVVSFTLNITSSIGKAVGGAAGGALDWLRDIMGFAKGGVVPGYSGEPRVVMAHGGETIVPANQSGGNVTLNVSGTLFRTEEEMYQRVADRLRAELWRQNV